RWERSLLGIVNQSSNAPKYNVMPIDNPGPEVGDDYVRVLPVANLVPSASAYQFDNALTNPDGRTARRLGAKLTLEFRRNRLFVLAGGTAFLAEGAASSRGFLDNENDQGQIGETSLDPNAAINARGRLFGDRAYTGKISTVYRFPSNMT